MCCWAPLAGLAVIRSQQAGVGRLGECNPSRKHYEQRNRCASRPTCACMHRSEWRRSQRPASDGLCRCQEGSDECVVWCWRLAKGGHAHGQHGRCNPLMIGTLCRRMVEARGVCVAYWSSTTACIAVHTLAVVQHRCVSTQHSLPVTFSSRQHDTVMGCCDGTKSLYYEPQQL